MVLNIKPINEIIDKKNMNIKFIKDLTEKDRDGFRLLYRVDDNDLELQISNTLLGILDITANNVEELLEQYRFEALIDSIDTKYSERKDEIMIIELTSFG